MGIRHSVAAPGAPIDSLFYFYDRSQLTGIVLNLPETRFQAVVAALSDKYGAPGLRTENVKNLKSHDKGKTFATILHHLEALGYFTHHAILNSLDFGVPQKRERTIIVGFLENIHFQFPKPHNLKPALGAVLEEDTQVEKKYFASEDIRKKRLAMVKKNPPVPSIWHENKSGNISALEYSCALRAGASYNYLLVNGTRRLTPRELLRLQGFPDTFKVVVPYTQIKKQTGNSVTVPVIRAVAQAMLESIQKKERAAPAMLQKNLWDQ